MPYKIVKQGEKYCVAKKTGETLKCYTSKKEAVKYLAALYANVKEARE